MNFLAKLKSFLSHFKPLSQKDLELRYLEQAVSIADLERRMKEIYGHGL